MTRGEGRKRHIRRGYSMGVTLGLLVGLLPVPVLLHLLPQPPGPSITPLPYKALRGHTGWVNSVDYSPDGQYVATGSDDGTAILWDASRGQKLTTLRGHTDAVDPVLFTSDGRYVVSASLDGTARLWTVPEGECVAIMAGDGEPIYDIGLVPPPVSDHPADGQQRLVTAGAAGHLQAWRVPQGDRIGDLRQESDAWDAVNFVGLAGYNVDGYAYLQAWFVGSAPTSFGIGNPYVATGLPGLKLLPADQMFPAECEPEPTDSLVTALGSASEHAIAGCADGSVHLLGRDSGCVAPANRAEHILLRGHQGRIESVAGHGRTGQIATAASDNTVRVWDVPTRRCLAVLRTAGPGIHDEWIERHSVSFSPDGKRLATAQGYVARIHELPE